MPATAEEIVQSLCDINIEVGGRGPSLCRESLFTSLSREEKSQVVAEAVKQKSIDRAVGCLVGMAVGDSVGHPLEFIPAVDMAGSTGHSFNCKNMSYQGELNKFRLQPGQWTDDTSMGLCIADSLILRRQYDGSDIRVRFWSWWFRGYNNTFRNDPTRCLSVGLGGNISASFSAMLPGQNPSPRFLASNEDAGIGSLMRVGPIPVYFHADLLSAVNTAAESSYTTHPGAVAAEACSFLSYAIARAITAGNPSPHDDIKRFLDDVAADYLTLLGTRSGHGVDEVRTLLEARQADCSLERCWNWKDASLDITGTLARRSPHYNGYKVSPGYFGAYCLDGLAVALFSVYHTTSFGAAIERCVNFLGDADSTAAVAGQLAGAVYGYTTIDNRFLENLRQWDDGEVALRGFLLHELGRQDRNVGALGT